jgi:hypothetical protein
MSLCPICKKEADKRNVHLIPWFLIKKCITYKGLGDRDTELSFTINPSDFTKVYFGRSVLPEHVEEFSDLTEIQKEKSNPDSRDYLLCHECEAKLSRLEAIFASQFNDKSIKAAYSSKLEKSNDQLVYTRANYSFSLYELLIQSIFYRCSIGNLGGILLKPSIKNGIEENLREAFEFDNFKKLRPLDTVPIKNSYPIIATIQQETEEKDTTEGFILSNISRIPYFIVAGRWTFQLFEKEKHLKSPSEWLYGLSTKVIAREAFAKVANISHAILLEKELSETVSKNILEYTVARKISGVKKNIRDLHFHIFKHKPSNYIAGYIYQQYFFYLRERKTEVDALVLAFLDLKKLTK